VRGAQGPQGPAGQQGPTGPQGLTGPRGPSNVRQFTDFTGQTNLASATQVGQLALPPGNHLVFGKTVLQGLLGGPASTEAQCHMDSGAPELDQGFTTITDGFITAETLNLQGTIAGPTTVTMTCSALGSNFNYQKVKMHAIQVESIG
jgi:hypothetical protein